MLLFFIPWKGSLEHSCLVQSYNNTDFTFWLLEHALGGWDMCSFLEINVHCLTMVYKALVNSCSYFYMHVSVPRNNMLNIVSVLGVGTCEGYCTHQ